MSKLPASVYSAHPPCRPITGQDRADAQCPTCGGTGRELVEVPGWHGYDTRRVHCDACEGTGDRPVYTRSRRRWRAELPITPRGRAARALESAAFWRKGASKDRVRASVEHARATRIAAEGEGRATRPEARARLDGLTGPAYRAAAWRLGLTVY